MNNRVKKPRSILALLIITVMILTMGIPLQSFAQSMSDIDGHWASSIISAWVDEGLINGYNDDTFKPEQSITRAEFSALVNRMFKFEETAEVTFSDVNEKDWFYADIGKAVKVDYLKGSDGMVRPNASITRQEVAIIIARLKALQESASDADTFKDAAGMPAWSKGYIGAVLKAGYMGGYPNGDFGFGDKLTRAQAVKALNNLRKIKLDTLADQKVTIGSTVRLAVKATPADAALSVVSSDAAVATVTATGSNIDVKGIKIGTATVTITAKKGVLPDGTASFKVTVEAAPVSGGGGGSTPPPAPSNSAPVITVVEPDGVNDGVITLTQGAIFTAPTVTAYDAEDGNLTTSIVKTGSVDANVPGEYWLTYNVKDSKNLAAAEKKVKVIVVAAEATANVTVQIAIIGETKVARVFVNSASVGSAFRLVGTTAPIAFGGKSQFDATGMTSANFELLNGAGVVVGTFTVSLSAGAFEVPVTVIPIPEGKVQGVVQLATIGETVVARVFVNASAEGVAFRKAGTTAPIAFGGKAQFDATGMSSADFELLDGANVVIGTFIVPLTAGNFEVAISEVAAPEKKAEGNIQLATIGSTVVARVFVTSASVGNAFRVEGSSSSIAFGGKAQFDATGMTSVTIELLNGSTVVGSFDLPLVNGPFSVDIE